MPLLPPEDFPTRDIPIIEIAAGTELFRIYRLDLDPVRYADGLDGRLNAPDGSYGVLYCAKQLDGAFAETFLRRPGKNQLTIELIRQRGMLTLLVTGTLRMAALHGPGLARMGATAEVTHGGLPYDAPQAWSQAIHRHSARIDGIAYYARHDDEQLCYAVFDRARERLAEAARQPDLNQMWFYEIANRYAVGLAPEA